MRKFASVLVIRQLYGTTFKPSISNLRPKLSNTSQAHNRQLKVISNQCRSIVPSETMSTSSNIQETDRRLKREHESGEDKHESARQRRQRKKTQHFATNRAIFSAAKGNDSQLAMEHFRQARGEGVSLPQPVMNCILYLLAGGENWMEKARIACQVTAEPSELTNQLKQCRDEVLSYMKEHKLLTDEMVWIAQARLSVCLGDPDEAYDLALDLTKTSESPRLRYFTPALLGYAEGRNMQKALEILHKLNSLELDLTELEFRHIFKACSASENAYREISALLKRMGRELTILEKKTIDEVRSYFESPLAKVAFLEEDLNHKQMWFLDEVTVDEKGFSVSAGEELLAIDLNEEDWNVFLEAFKELATRKELNKNAFLRFTEWVDEHGPFELVIDCANVGFHKQKQANNKLNYHQLAAFTRHIEQQFPERKVLMILHENRIKEKYIQHSDVRKFIADKTEQNQFFAAPHGSNDDWYWLYAALEAKGNGLLISNDECRDHIFQLLAPKYFLKWKERHLCRYEIVDNNAIIHLPSAYTSCTQQLSNGTWMLPFKNEKDEVRWLCIKPL